MSTSDCSSRSCGSDTRRRSSIQSSTPPSTAPSSELSSASLPVTPADDDDDDDDDDFLPVRRHLCIVITMSTVAILLPSAQIPFILKIRLSYFNLFSSAMRDARCAYFAVSRCPSVCHYSVLHQNYLIYRRNSFITWQPQHSTNQTAFRHSGGITLTYTTGHSTGGV